MKGILKSILVAALGAQIRRLRTKNDFKIVGVVGSIGKTSTKLAIGKALSSGFRVRYQEGNYNDLVSVPLIFFGHEMPNLWNVFAWLKIIFLNELQIFSDYPYDFVVVELGTDGPGQIAAFRKYLHLDVAVLTAVAPEHMQFFQSLEKVAEEEWSVGFFSDLIFVNRDLVEIVPENVDHKKIVFYGKGFGAIYKLENISKTKNGFNFEISYKGGKMLELFYPAFSEVELYSVCAAAALGRHFELPPSALKDTLENIQSFAGRMQKLKGIKDSVIIDDTYNASPTSVRLALDALAGYPAKQKIAILGMMNELGLSSKEEHEKVGKYCDPKVLDLVVTVGSHANQFLASAAHGNGCRVYKAKDALDAGKFVTKEIKEGAVILAKGSQNGVFTEEALKPLLADSADFSKLVRQDATWLKKKRLTFGQN